MSIRLAVWFAAAAAGVWTLSPHANAQCPAILTATQTVAQTQAHPPTSYRSNDVRMTYDRAHHVTVALNRNPATGLFEEWTYATGEWENTTTGFAAEIYGVTFDTTRSRLVAFGRHLEGDSFSSSWVREVSGWVRNIATHPSTAIDSFHVVYDPVRDRYCALEHVTVGAQTREAIVEINPTNWQWTTGPTYPGDVRLTSRAMCFDLIGGNIQFWGYDSNDLERVVTFQWPSTWTELPLSTPVTFGPRDRSTGVWSDRLQCMIVSSGVNPSNRYTNSSQNAFGRLFLDGGAPYENRKIWTIGWYPDSGNSQPTRVNVGMAYDSDRNTLVTFGGAYYYIASTDPLVGDVLAHDKTYELALPAGPAINVQPTGYVGCDGDSHDLVFVPQFGSPQSVQWFFRPTGSTSYQPVPGATTLTYPNRPWQQSDNGTYVARITTPPEDVYCDVRTRSWTDPVQVSVTAPLNLSGSAQWPINACPGESVMVVAPNISGPGAIIALQKQGADLSWVDVAFATPDEPFFFLANLAQSDSGLYRVNARNACNSLVTPEHHFQVGVTIDSPLAMLGEAAPCQWIQMRPLDGTINSVGTTSFRWYLDGVPVSESARVSGTQTSTLTIDSLNYSDAGRYELRVTDDSCGSTASIFRDLVLPSPTEVRYVQRDLPGSLPPPRQSHAMAYDEARGVVVLYGGRGRDAQGQPQILADTWTYDGNSWELRSPAQSPGFVANASMVYDRDRGKVILFGGDHALCPTCVAPPKAQTWEWDGDNWTLRSTVGPADERASSPSLAYDTLAHRVVLYTSSNPSSSLYQGETWNYDPVANSWTIRSQAGPSTGFGTPAMYFDPGTGKLVMYAYAPVPGPLGTPLPGFWEWTGSAWSVGLADSTGTWTTGQQPFPFSASAINTWAYNPSTRSGESGLMTVVPPGGGGYWSGTYRYASGTPAVTRLAPNNLFGRSGAAQVWDARRRCMVIFGGQETFPGVPNPGAPTNTTFELHAVGRPELLDQPVPATTCSGVPIILRVAAAGDSIAYRWRRDEIPVDNVGGISGAFSAVLSISNPSPLDTGSYTCIATNACGESTSAGAWVTVLDPGAHECTACPACAADFDQDGGLTGADLGAFIAGYEAGAPCADVDQDGGVTPADLGLFVTLYEAGGC